MIKTGGKLDQDRHFFYGDEKKENGSGDDVLFKFCIPVIGPLEINKLFLVVGIIMAIILTCGLLVTVIPGLTNQDHWL